MGYLWAPTPFTINWQREDHGKVCMYPDSFMNVEKLNSVLPHALKCSFFLLESWQAKESSLIFEIQFNSRNDGALTEPIEEAMKESAGAWLFGH